MGQVITFYSFKGGTGRTFALVNIGYLLSVTQKKSVLMIDWDLDAPGLDKYLEPYLPPDESQNEGLIEFMDSIRNRLSRTRVKSRNNKLIDQIIDETLEPFIQPVESLSSLLFYMKSGQPGEGYSKKIQKFNWRSFFKNFPEFFTQFANYLSSNFDFVLIDARTGLTDIGGICTMLMPEKLVLVHTMNNQSIDGVIDIAKKAIEYRKNSNDLRSLVIFPLPSRVDLDEKYLQEEWKSKYYEKFRNLVIESYALPKSIKVDKYFNNVLIRYASNYSFGEKIAVSETYDNSRYSLTQAFNSFIIQMNDIGKIWEYEPFSNLLQPLSAKIIYTEKDSELRDFFINQTKQLVLKKAIRFEEPVKPVERWESEQHLSITFKKYDVLILLLTENFHFSEEIESDLKSFQLIKLKSEGDSEIFEMDKKKFVFVISFIEKPELPEFLSESIRIPRFFKSMDSHEIFWVNVAKEFENELIIIADNYDDK